ncbi:MAG: metallophosphoesterase [Bacteroidales bacterium]|jgi:predicted MPP superfamily phosphohydrolase|nr:metallophosphoesterase [Bacteroidales bacterium]
MKQIQIIMFFLIVFTVYSLAHYYLFNRSVQIFSMTGSTKKWFTFSFILLSSLFVLGMILERNYSSVFSEWVLRIGTSWMAFLLYFIIAAICVDIVRIIDYIVPFLPDISQSHKTLFGVLIIAVVGITVLLGHINAKNIRIKEIPLTIHKELEGVQNFRILMASDIHLGPIIGRSWEEKFLRIVDEQQPDVVLLCGDIVDGDIKPVLRKRLGNHLQQIDTPYGIFGISGNHEHIGGIDKALEYFKNINIPILYDEHSTLANGIQIVGRKDLHGGTRKSLDSLLQDLDRSKPIIVMDHQPYHLDKAAEAGIDLHLSGHTHNGQMWPLNYITEALFELSWGYLKKGNSHFYVSSGYGTWGPTVRIGNHPEVVVFSLSFE